MTPKTRREGFELLAKDAEERAALVKDPQTRDTWLRIAESHQELAENTPDSTVSRGGPIDQFDPMTLASLVATE